MLIIIKWETAYKYCYIVGFFNPPEQNLPVEKHYSVEWDYYSLLKHVIKETGPKVGCFTDFCHHRLMAMSSHTHAYRYPLVESGTNIGLRAITLHRQDSVLLSKHK